MNSINGDIAEFSFDIQAIGNGLIVCRPIHSGTVYDRIVDNGKRLFRVQVKSVTFKPKDRYYRFHLRRGNSSKYKNHEVDVFACYIHKRNEWYLVPNTGITTFNANTDKFKENWSIFEEV